MKGPAYQQKNTFMVPLTSITQALNITYKVNQSAKTVVLNLNTKPVASFTVPKEIFAGDTVTYNTKSSSPKGLDIVDERWTGRQDSFDQPGTYTVTYAVQDSSGQWSDPDYRLDYNIIMIEENKDPMAVWSTLPVLDRDGVHNRGTYPNATRVITYDQEVGSKPARLPLGDNASDPNLVGTDPMTYTDASNAGNFGVLYKITLNNVAPRTLISFNPRGGKYSGVALVNGSYGEAVTIVFSAAPGSNLPVNLLFTPLPTEK
ncbi:hypothetical protein G195_001309 [Phytophthora kernoviae 00238/432]|uniref:Uncharacterized protein n=1 Tax=Phytophthora kernoviae 00238/432 TaxID=1284355 RepID=A0A8J4WQF4_9STRA|nr:hypothetical protein G195_001309 [Phytophthora kernoviae 00238/432]